MRGLGGAELGACLTHGRGELHRNREYSMKNGVKNLKEAQAIPSFLLCKISGIYNLDWMILLTDPSAFRAFFSRVPHFFLILSQ